MLESAMLMQTPDDEALAKAARLLDVMSNEKRLQILSLITKNEVSVGPLAKQLGLSQSAMSQHLHKLRVAKLVHFRRDAQTIYYSCESQDVARVLDVLEEIFVTPSDHSRAAV